LSQAFETKIIFLLSFFCQVNTNFFYLYKSIVCYFFSYDKVTLRVISEQTLKNLEQI